VGLKSSSNSLCMEERVDPRRESAEPSGAMPAL
jgi:hypothetical protein